MQLLSLQCCCRTWLCLLDQWCSDQAVCGTSFSHPVPYVDNLVCLQVIGWFEILEEGHCQPDNFPIFVSPAQ